MNLGSQPVGRGHAHLSLPSLQEVMQARDINLAVMRPALYKLK